MNRNLMMRAMTMFLALVLVVGVADAKGKVEYKECKFKTSACCPETKAKLEKGLKKAEGVKTAKVNSDEKTATIKYDPAKTTPDKLKAAIVALGFTAETVAPVETVTPATQSKATKCGGCTKSCPGNSTLRTGTK